MIPVVVCFDSNGRLDLNSIASSGGNGPRLGLSQTVRIDARKNAKIGAR